jgi:hypothetical protein
MFITQQGKQNMNLRFIELNNTFLWRCWRTLHAWHVTDWRDTISAFGVLAEARLTHAIPTLAAAIPPCERKTWASKPSRHESDRREPD